MVEVNTILVHRQPHWDEAVAVVLLQDFGEKMFPGIKEAKVEFVNGAERQDPDVLESNGVLCVGLFGSRFDDKTAQGERKERECSATVVAKILGIEEHPGLTDLLRYTLSHDSEPKEQPFDLTKVVKVMHRLDPKSPRRTLQWAMKAVRALIENQMKFLTTTLGEFNHLARVERITGPRNAELTIASIESDDKRMNELARSSYGCNAAVVIQRSSGGNIRIYTSEYQRKKFGFRLDDVVSMIRLEEQKKREDVKLADSKELRKEGTLPQIPQWFYFVDGQMLLNGSTTNTVEPTVLTLQEVTDLVVTALSVNSFHPHFESRCRQGKCLSSPKVPCPWYEWGLHRCRQIRFKQFEARHTQREQRKESQTQA